MIVCAIVGLLLAIAVPSFARAKRIHHLYETGALSQGETYDLVLDQRGFYDNRLKSRIKATGDYGPLGTNDSLVGIATSMEAQFVKTQCNDGWFILRDIKTGSQWVGWEENCGQPKILSPYTTTKPVQAEAP